MKFDTCVKYVQELSDLVAHYKKKYGVNSEIVYTLMMELLTFQFMLKETLCGNDMDEKFISTYSELVDIIRSLKIPTGNYKPMHKCADGSISFDKDYYQENYGNELEKYKEKIIEVDNMSLLEYATFNWYLYVLTKSRKLIIFKEPFSQFEMLFNRDMYPKHVVLAYNYGLTVLCAGEILIGKDKNNSLSLIVNNRSGHYRPDSNNLSIVKKYLGKFVSNVYSIDCSKGRILSVYRS